MSKVLGVDASRYKGAINFDRMGSEGVRFFIARCTIGDYYIDPMFEANYAAAEKVGMLVAPYIVIAPAATTGGRPISAKGHWDKFIAAIGDKVLDLPVVLDCELTRGMSKDYVSQLILDVANMAKDWNGREPIIYTGPYWWIENVNRGAQWKRFPLWLAQYPYTSKASKKHQLENWTADPRNAQVVKDYKGDLWQGFLVWAEGRAPMLPPDWETWHLWQFSADTNGVGRHYGTSSDDVDLNYFNGDMKALLQFCMAPVVIEPDPDPEPIPDPDPVDPIDPVDPGCDEVQHAKVLMNLNVRLQPKIPSSVVSQFTKGTKVLIVDTFTNGADVWRLVLHDDMRAGWCAEVYKGTRYLEIL